MFKGLSFSDFVVRFPEFVFLVLRCPISDFTVYDFANSDLQLFRFPIPISDRLSFDVKVVVFRISIYKFQASMSNR